MPTIAGLPKPNSKSECRPRYGGTELGMVVHIFDSSRQEAEASRPL